MPVPGARPRAQQRPVWLRAQAKSAVLMALALELGMLLTPYPQVFGIAVNAYFVAVTIAAHGIFGVGLGLTVRFVAAR